MFKLLGWLLKATLFAALVLVASHLITWNGKSVSDQVRTGLSSVERTTNAGDRLKTVKRKSRALVEDAREAASKIGVSTAPQARKKIHGESPSDRDREELQALIHSSDAG